MVGKKGIKTVGFCEVIKLAIFFVTAIRQLNVFCEYTTMINSDGFLTTGTVISEVIEQLGNFILQLQKGNKVYFVSTLR